MGQRDGANQIGLDLAIDVGPLHVRKWAELADACIVDEAWFKVIGQFAKGQRGAFSAHILRDVARHGNDRWCAQLHALR